MTALDTTARALATRAIAKYGKAITYKRHAPGTYDPATGRHTPVDSSFSIKARVDGVRRRPNMSAAELSLLAGLDFAVTIAAADIAFTPAKGDAVTVDGVDYTVVYDPTPTFSGELVALWDLLVKS